MREHPTGSIQIQCVVINRRKEKNVHVTQFGAKTVRRRGCRVTASVAGGGFPVRREGGTAVKGLTSTGGGKRTGVNGLISTKQLGNERVLAAREVRAEVGAEGWHQRRLYKLQPGFTSLLRTKVALSTFMDHFAKLRLHLVLSQAWL